MIKTEEQNALKVVRWGIGLTIVLTYAFTGSDGVLILLGAFLLGFPLEKLPPKKETL